MPHAHADLVKRSRCRRLSSSIPLLSGACWYGSVSLFVTVFAWMCAKHCAAKWTSDGIILDVLYPSLRFLRFFVMAECGLAKIMLDQMQRLLSLADNSKGFGFGLTWRCTVQTWYSGAFTRDCIVVCVYVRAWVCNLNLVAVPTTHC